MEVVVSFSFTTDVCEYLSHFFSHVKPSSTFKDTVRSTRKFDPSFSNMEGEKKSIYVEFRVKTTANAAILLAPCRGCDGYEIVLGMRGDTVSVIRQRKRRPTVAGTKSV